MSVLIRPLHSDDHADWARLYAGYAAFYGVAQTDAMRDTVWGWLLDAASGVAGLIAVDAGGQAIGIAHCRAFRRPLSASVGGYLDDLFVDPEARGSGAAQALIGAVADLGRQKGWSVVRWITAADNQRARAVYDQLATPTPWVTYDLKV